MKLLAVSLATIVLLYSPIGVTASAPAAVCYYNKQKCCFNYAACGYESKKVDKQVDCPYNKCEDAYKTECYPVPKCSYKKEQDGQTCEDVPDPSGYGTVQKCYPKYVNKEYCVNEQKCEQKKYSKCYDVAAYCVKYYYYDYAKYCATLTCDNLYLDSGSDKAPADYVVPEGNLTKTEDGKRYDK